MSEAPESPEAPEASGAAGALRLLIEALDAQKIPYYIAGSIASSLFGVVRYTNDIDLVAEIRLDQVAELAKSLQGGFYADPEMMTSALMQGRSFSFIHLASAHKFDIFPASNDPFQRSQMQRRTHADLSAAGLAGIVAPLATVEDSILAKLLWYRKSNSEQQWKDLLGMAHVQRGRLDLEYLRRWARELGVESLLDELLGGSGH